MNAGAHPGIELVVTTTQDELMSPKVSYALRRDFASHMPAASQTQT